MTKLNLAEYPKQHKSLELINEINTVWSNGEKVEKEILKEYHEEFWKDFQIQLYEDIETNDGYVWLAVFELKVEETNILVFLPTQGDRFVEVYSKGDLEEEQVFDEVLRFSKELVSLTESTVEDENLDLREKYYASKRELEEVSYKLRGNSLKVLLSVIKKYQDEGVMPEFIEEQLNGEEKNRWIYSLNMLERAKQTWGFQVDRTDKEDLKEKTSQIVERLIEFRTSAKRVGFAFDLESSHDPKRRAIKNVQMSTGCFYKPLFDFKLVLASYPEKEIFCQRVMTFDGIIVLVDIDENYYVYFEDSFGGYCIHKSIDKDSAVYRMREKIMEGKMELSSD